MQTAALHFGEVIQQLTLLRISQMYQLANCKAFSCLKDRRLMQTVALYLVEMIQQPTLLRISRLFDSRLMQTAAQHLSEVIQQTTLLRISQMHQLVKCKAFICF